MLDRYDEVIKIPLSQRQEKAIVTSISDIPKELQYAVIFSEDKRFFQHHGVDFLALFRTTYQTIKNLKFTSGASTISMQLARIYWPELSKPSAKIAQIIQAIRIERHNTKFEILEHYLNLIPFANQTIGVAQGCFFFFNKSCDRLSLAESTALAIIPRNPTFYSKNKTQLFQDRNKLIKKIAPKLNVDEVSLSQALAEPIKFDHGIIYSYGYHYSLKVLQENPSKLKREIRTTLDLSLQKKVENLLLESVNKNPNLGNSGAILIVENNSGEVLSYVGSPDYFKSDYGMVDAVQSLRSPGSALKPFIYAKALENGWTLSSLIPDMPLKLKVGNGIFLPDNYGGNFSGPRQLRFALANSKNIPALILTMRLGEASILDFLHLAEFNSLKKSSEHYGAGIALGNGEVSLWELVQAYSIFSNGGMLRRLKLVKSSSGQDDVKEVISEETAFLITDVLSDPAARSEEFGRNGPMEFNFKVAAKTGTSSGFRDHWIVGYTPSYTIGIWKGNANGSPIKLQVSASKNVGPLFKQIINMLHDQNEKFNYSKPDKIAEIKVCSLSGEIAGPDCSHTRIESFYKYHLPLHICSYHQQKLIQNCNGKSKYVKYTALPQEYAGWAEANSVPTLNRVLKEQCGWNDANISQKSFDSEKENKDFLQITEPISGTILALDPSIPAEYQMLRIQFSDGGQRDLTLFVNDKPFTKIGGKTSEKTFVEWPITRGEFEFRIKSKTDGKNSEVVRIKVL